MKAFTDRPSARVVRITQLSLLDEVPEETVWEAPLIADSWQIKKASAVPHASAILPTPKHCQP